jgi:hypothetical protein
MKHMAAIRQHAHLIFLLKRHHTKALVLPDSLDNFQRLLLS